MDNIRPVTKNDLEGLKKVLDSCGLFPSAYLDDMISDYFNNADTTDIWFTYIDQNVPVAIAYCVPEKFTNGTYNLLAIGVAENSQGKGIASTMIQYLEQELKQIKARVLIVETSSEEAQLGARKLYKKLAYTQMAVLKDFWDEEEDKIIFWKKL